MDVLPLAGEVALCGMASLYAAMVAFHLWPHALVVVRRWVYAGLYMDEGYTHWVLQLWPVRWADLSMQTRRPMAILTAPVVPARGLSNADSTP